MSLVRPENNITSRVTTGSIAEDVPKHGLERYFGARRPMLGVVTAAKDASATHDIAKRSESSLEGPGDATMSDRKAGMRDWVAHLRSWSVLCSLLSVGTQVGEDEDTVF